MKVIQLKFALLSFDCHYKTYEHMEVSDEM